MRVDISVTSDDRDHTHNNNCSTGRYCAYNCNRDLTPIDTVATLYKECLNIEVTANKGDRRTPLKAETLDSPE